MVYWNTAIVTAALGTHFYYITVLTASLLHYTEYNTALIPLYIDPRILCHYMVAMPLRL
jgi:hypothetical protein